MTNVLFGGRDFNTLGLDDIEVLAGEIPTVGLNKTMIEILTESGVAGSNGEARRLMASGAISIDGEKITDDCLISEACLVKKGKNSFILVR